MSRNTKSADSKDGLQLMPSSSASPVKPEWIRLPLPAARCPYTGLSRTTLCELSTPCPTNDHNPPVKSVVIKKRGALRGIRLINFDSLMAHLADLPNTGGEEGGHEA